MWGGWLVQAALALGVVAAAQDVVVLQNSELRLEIDRGTGALSRFTALATGWELIPAGRGLSFRLLLPVGGPMPQPGVHTHRRRDNSVLGTPVIDADATSANITWDKVLSEHAGIQNVKVQLSVKLVGDQAVWGAVIDNQCDLVVENVYWPYLGDLQRPEGAEALVMWTRGYSDPSVYSLYPLFPNTMGYYGTNYPESMLNSPIAFGAPPAPYVLVWDSNSNGQGMYFGVHEPLSDLVTWQAELRPGYVSSMSPLVPSEKEINGQPVVTRFATIHVPYIQPGEVRRLTPVAAQPFRGGWQQGLDIYKKWLGTWFKPSQLPDWVKEPHSWQQIQLNDPEDNLNVNYTEFSRVGAMAAHYGVKAIQVTGWTIGGQDQDNPSHDIDLRLGSWQDFNRSIAATKELGVKVILFSKYTWGDRTTQWFKDTLIHSATKDPYGDYYLHEGYTYETPTQLLDINTKRFAPMCFMDPAYQEVAQKEFAKELALQPDGILFDECLHHGPAKLCFDTTHGHRLGAPVYSADRDLIRNFSKMTGNSQFLFGGEAPYDWEYETYHLGYFRTQNSNHVPQSRYIFPHQPIATAIIGFNDRNMLNQCLMYRYIPSYEPLDFKGWLDMIPETMAYGAQMHQLRVELRKFFWDGEFRDVLNAQVISVPELSEINLSSSVLSPGGRTKNSLPENLTAGPTVYSVFLGSDYTPHSGSCGVVIANYDMTASETVTVHPENECAEFTTGRWRLVDNSTWHEWGPTVSVTIPPQSAAVIVPT